MKRVLVEIIAAVVLVIGGALVLWGSRFASDMVHDNLAEQQIFFPPAAALEEGGRSDLVQYAEQQVDNGPEAKAYSSYIKGHLADVNEGKTYSQTSSEARAARAEATAAQEAGDEALFEELNATATSLEGKVNTLFRGETLRGLLLFSWGWWLVGQIAFWVGIGLFLAAVALMIAAFMTRPKADKATKAPAPDGSHERIETPAGV